MSKLREESSPWKGLGLLAALWLVSATNLCAQGTVFTYQGVLNDNGQRASGTYDLVFTLYDSTNLPGNVIAGPVTNASVFVTNGLFAASLDFGNAFNGDARWLEIDVRTNRGGYFYPLYPRQPLAAVPYAMFSAAAINASNAVNASNLVGPLSTANLAPMTAQMTALVASTSNSLNSAFSTNMASEIAAGLASSNMLLQSEWFPNQQAGISRTPPLGIASWYGSFDHTSWTNHGSVMGIQAALSNANLTLYPFGYRYLCLDDGWGTTNLDTNGLMQLSPAIASTFGAGASGVQNFINAVHTNGWKVGFYADGGTNYSAGGYQHGIGGDLLWTNVAALGRYGMDLLKSDQTLYDKERIAAIISANGYPIFLTGSATTGDGPLPAVVPAMMNSWRSVSGGDITSYQELIRWTDVAMTNNWWTWVQPGHFIDMDYIGGESYRGGAVATKTHFVIDALFSAPIWNDAPFDPGSPVNPIATNTALLAINQDPAVICAQRYLQSNYCDVYVKPLGSPSGPQFALGVVSRADTFTTSVTVYYTNLPPLLQSGVANWSAFDCVSNAGWVSQGKDSFTVTLGMCDSVLWRLVPGYAMFTNIVSVSWPDSVTMSVISNGVPYITYGAWDADASNYVARAGLTNQTEILAAAVAISLGKQHGWWNLFDGLYLFRGSTSNSTAQNLVSKNYGIQWHGTVGFGWNGVTGDAISGYGDTGFNPSTASHPKWSLNSASFFLYSQSQQPVASRPIGASSGTMRSDVDWDGFTTMSLGGLNTGNFFPAAMNVTLAGSRNCTGGFLLTRTDTATQSMYQGTNFRQADTTAATTLPDQNFYVLAENSYGPSKPSNINLSAAGFGAGMTAAQWGVFYGDMQTVENILRIKMP